MKEKNVRVLPYDFVRLYLCFVRLYFENLACQTIFPDDFVRLCLETCWTPWSKWFVEKKNKTKKRRAAPPKAAERRKKPQKVVLGGKKKTIFGRVRLYLCFVRLYIEISACPTITADMFV